MNNTQDRVSPCGGWKGKGGGPIGHQSKLKECFAHKGLRGHIKIKEWCGDQKGKP